MTLALAVPSGSHMVDPKRAAHEFWLARSRAQGIAAVHSSERWARYHRWTRAMLMAWTMGRIRAAGGPYIRCADLGCGIGDWTERLAGLAVETYACDLSPTFVEATQLRVPGASVCCADLRDYALPADLDLVYIGAVLMYLPDDAVRDVFRRVRAAARPNALVIVRDYGAINAGRPSVNARDDFFSIHRTPRMLERLAADGYLRCVERRVSPSIYGEVMSRGTAIQWPLRALWRAATATWTRASFTLILRAD